MKTVSVNIMNLCVPCENRCRYCLLSWNGKLRGVDYERSQSYAHRFYNWAKENRPELVVTFGFGYSMEHPDLRKAIDFLNAIGSPSGKFLQLDGLKFRDSAEIRSFLSDIQTHGVEQINLTFYGTQEYHDRFAGRAGDFIFMIDLLRQANAIGLAVSAGIPMTHENAGLADSLIGELESFKLNSLFCFVPHQEGRGVCLNKVRFRQEDFDALSERVKKYLNPTRFKTEAQWLAENRFSTPQRRALYLSLTPENMAFFEKLPFAQAIAHLENLDDTYYRIIPPLEQLAGQYGEPSNTEYFSERDLYLKYQNRYITEHNINIYDINDERQCCSRRF